MTTADGRLDIATEGRAVFRLTELLDEKEYHEGLVEYVTDEPSRLDSGKRAKLVTAFEQAHEFLFGQPWTQGPSEDEATLAYRMAALLPVELDKRQALLESDRRASAGIWSSAGSTRCFRSSPTGSERASAPGATVTR